MLLNPSVKNFRLRVAAMQETVARDRTEHPYAERILLRCISPEVAPLCRPPMSALLPLSRGDLNRSTQHLLILLDEEVADGDVTDIVHGEAEG